MKTLFVGGSHDGAIIDVPNTKQEIMLPTRKALVPTTKVCTCGKHMTPPCLETEVYRKIIFASSNPCKQIAIFVYPESSQQNRFEFAIKRLIQFYRPK